MLPVIYRFHIVNCERISLNTGGKQGTFEKADPADFAFHFRRDGNGVEIHPVGINGRNLIQHFLCHFIIRRYIHDLILPDVAGYCLILPNIARTIYGLPFIKMKISVWSLMIFMLASMPFPKF